MRSVAHIFAIAMLAASLASAASESGWTLVRQDETPRVYAITKSMHTNLNLAAQLCSLLDATLSPEAAGLQDAQVRAYADALALDSIGLEFCRDLVAQGVEAARADHDRFEVNLRSAQVERQYRDVPLREDLTDPDLVARILAFEQLPEDTLGYALTRFYADFGLDVPGATASTINYLFVAHDMNHVIAGYEPVAAGDDVIPEGVTFRPGEAPCVSGCAGGICG